MKRLRLKQQLCLTGLLIFALSAVWIHHRVANSGIVNVSAGSFPTCVGSDSVVTQTLASALQQNPQAKQFRVRWILLGNAKGPLPCEIEYNRSSRQLSELSIRSGMGQRFIYTNVTDALIYKVAQEGHAIYLLKNHGAGFKINLSFLAQVKLYLSSIFGR